MSCVADPVVGVDRAVAVVVVVVVAEVFVVGVGVLLPTVVVVKFEVNLRRELLAVLVVDAGCCKCNGSSSAPPIRSVALVLAVVVIVVVNSGSSSSSALEFCSKRCARKAWVAASSGRVMTKDTSDTKLAGRTK